MLHKLLTAFIILVKRKIECGSTSKNLELQPNYGKSILYDLLTK